MIKLFNFLKQQCYIIKNFISTNLNDIDTALKFNRIVNNNNIDKEYKIVTKYSVVRIALLFIILFFVYNIWKTTTIMYKTTGTVDGQWVLYGSAFTALLTLYATFYTSNVSKEIINRDNNNSEIKKKIIDNNHNGIPDDEEEMCNIDSFGDITDNDDL